MTQKNSNTKQPITDRVKTYADACQVLGKPVIEDWGDREPDEIAFLKLRTIVEALNEGWRPEFIAEEWRYFPWFFLYDADEVAEMGDEEKADRRLMDITATYQTSYAGFGYAYSADAPSDSNAYIGSRLCLKNASLAVYCGKQFIELWADYTLTRK